MRGGKLYIPEPKARPGDRPDFSHLIIPEPGALDRPSPHAPEQDLRHLPYGLIRVLADDGQAAGQWVPDLADETLRDGLAHMMLTRTFDDRLFRLHRQGKTSFFMKSTGEEACAVAPSMALRRTDMAFPTYRVAGWLHARSYPLDKMINQIFSNAADPLRGRQLPILYSARDYGFYSLSGNVGSRFGHAVGWAMAAAYSGTDDIALAYIGDGTTAEGDFHEALTFASVYRAPAILCVTNNQWAISSYSGIAGGEATTFAAKALGFGIPGLRVDGNDFLAIWAAMDWAAQRARAGDGATLIELVTYRAAGHSTSDDPTRYRPADEAEHWPLGDPIARLRQHLITKSAWDDERDAALQAEIVARVTSAVRASEAIGTLGKSKPPLTEMFKDVFREPDWRIREQMEELGLTDA